MSFSEVKSRVEEFFNGKFEVKKFLGEGSFAKVYLVNHNYLDTLMAMKIIKEPLSPSTNKKNVFREVTIACQLRHPNIISIYDAAEISDLDDGENHAYFVMEYVSGGDLERYFHSFVENNMMMPVERCLDLIKQILSGLNTLHSANPPIIHRDLKLNNVLLSFNACGQIIIKISDFGFAKEVTTSISDIDVAGTRPYMAPELFKKSVSTRSDIYAVGVMFYQMLTNRFPYDVEKYTTEELIDLKPWNNELIPPSEYNGKVSGNLDEIVMKCLDRDPSRRYSDASDLLSDVEKAIDSYKSSQIVPQSNSDTDYYEEYSQYVINDTIKRAFDLAKCENGLDEAIELLENEVLGNYEIRKCYSETLRIWKSERPDLKLISKAFTVNLKGRNYIWSCSLLREAIAYNPSIRNKYQHYLDLWEMFIDLEKHGSLFKSVVILENLMDESTEVKRLYENILPVLKTYSIEEIVIEALRLVKSNNLSDAARLMEFAVVADSQIRKKYSYRLSLWKQNMKMHFTQSREIKDNTVDYAIDLGTTDSIVSYFNNGNPVIIKNHKTGFDFTPSAVLIDDNGNLKVGESAKQAILENSRNSVSEFKHNMGFSVPFKFENSSRVMFPEELSAEVLKDLRLSVYKQMGVNIEHAVICVPANSNPIKTKAINDAAELAGFRSHSLILEPIAVCLAYGLRKDNANWMIYDLGGGTFNVTLIHDNNGEIEKLATDGLDNLGGNAFDWKIVNDLFKPKIAYDLNLDDFRRDNSKYFKIFQILKNAAEAAKKDLNISDTAYICIPNLFDGYDFRYILTRDRFKDIIMPLINHTLNLSRKLLNDNLLYDGDIEKVILVGGSTLSPIVQECIGDEFDIEIESGIDPLTVVSKGASVYAGSLEKPQMEIKSHPVSILLNHVNGWIKGKLFSNDLKFSYLGYELEFKNENETFKIPVNIDGTFKLHLSQKSYDINIYDGEKLLKPDLKSPVRIEGGNIYIPYFTDAFEIKDNLNLGELLGHYSRLLKEMDCLNEYSAFHETEIQKYTELLLEIAQRDNVAINQAKIYIDHLDSLIVKAKNDLKFSLLSENVLKKMEVVKNNNLFEIGDIDDILKSGDFEALSEFYSGLIEKYVLLDMNRVIEECFYNLKFDGIYSDNEKLAFELIEKAQTALYNRDYRELFSEVNLLYELDERSKNRKIL